MTAWTPLFTGSEADRVREVALDIAAALRTLPDELQVAAREASVSSGAAGLALFFASLHEVTGDEVDADDAVAFADQAIVASEQAPTYASLFAGQVGVGWALHQLEGRLFEPDEGEDDVDELVEAALSERPWGRTYDLINGIVGLGVYALDRLPRPTARRSAAAAIEQLSSLAEEADDGVTWRTVPSMLPNVPVMAQRIARWPDGYYDLGLSHGVAGAVAFLSAASEAGVNETKALLEPSARWLRAQRIEEVDHGHHGHGDGHDCGQRAGGYPLMFGPGETGGPGRVAWCYGDPSVSVALLAAGHALQDTELMDEGRRLAIACSEVAPASTGVNDAGLCHGAAGLGHVFNRLHHRSGSEHLRDRARAWFSIALDMHQPGEGVGGYLSVQPDRSTGTYVPQAVPGLLEGSAGIGLALLATISEREPTWDQLLLLSTRGRA